MQHDDLRYELDEPSGTGTAYSQDDPYDVPSETEYVPRMPCVAATRQQHRPKAMPGLFNACVARPVTPKEAKTNSKARDAMTAEWQRLRSVRRSDGKQGCWDEDGVREWQDVRREAKRDGVKNHIGSVFGIIVEKNAELPVDDPKRKYKGRAVFAGDNVRDEVGQWAIFQDLGSCPATMEAARTADAYGCLPGHAVQQCDA